ncbi:MAG: dTMP kinase [Hydrocarboniphaga sp.]|uniref:dTMP kinase n=1 Tax=Hydrocarboniphaga sp. TaxID=2033016 RepID=UPI00260479B1|nr:dTMP kinase [Hydrocarboniphaga sp.]MDB5968057.1 dTMP kinase [Hydrocarboniphaga sp.]
MSRGRLITLEGGEGAGKTTHSKTIAAWLKAQGRDVINTREPGGSPLAEAIRGVVLADWAEGIDAPTELLLIFAARAAHLRATLLPALERGSDVVCDRFIDASWAYQGAGRGLPAKALQAMEDLVLDGLHPDLTLIFDIAPELGLARAKGRGNLNRFEAENLAFMQRVRQSYLDRAAAAPQRCVVLDASLAIDQVERQLRQVLESRL